MANQYDMQDTGDQGGDWWSSNAPPQAGPATLQDVIAIYQSALGRDPEPGAAEAWLAGTGGDLNEIRQGIEGSGEAKARSAPGAPGATGGGQTTTPSGPQGGDYQGWFNSLVAGKPFNQQTILDLEPQLNAAGFKLTPPNANGERTKIQLPSGEWVRVGFGEGHPVWIPQGGSSGADGGGGNQFAGYGGGDPAGFGTPPAPYQSAEWTGGSFTPPPLPAALQQPYEAPVWQGGDFQAPDKPAALNTPYAPPPLPASLQSEYVAPQFTAPTQAQAEAEPGYLTRMKAGQQVLERSAAARGTVLNGGTQQALARYGQDYGANEYQNVYGRALGTFGVNTAAELAGRQQNLNEYQTSAGIGLGARQQNQGEYQTDFVNAFDKYLQKYRQFGDAANMGLQARQQNQGEYQQAVGNELTAQNNRYGQYLDSNSRTLQDYLTNAGVQRNAQTDYWSRLRDLSGSGLTAALGTR